MSILDRAQALTQALENRLLGVTCVCPSIERADYGLVEIHYEQVNPRFRSGFLSKAEIKNLVVSFFADSHFNGFRIERNQFVQDGYILTISESAFVQNLEKFKK